jgi:hypothetical protein
LLNQRLYFVALLRSQSERLDDLGLLPPMRGRGAGQARERPRQEDAPCYNQ